MKKLLLPLVIVAAFLMQSCSTVAVTGRKQLNLVSDSEVLTASLTQYSDYMKTAKKSTNSKQTAQVVRVGKKIAAATEKYLTDNGMSNELKNFSWEFSLVQSDEVNAFCMPGGKIVVYEGLLSVAQTEAELATVIGHEIGHAVAKHSNERMSQQIMTQYGMAILSEALSQKSAAVQTVATSVFGLGAQVGIMLPYSRKHEYEADYMGIVFMEIAGYDSESALDFWTKMAAGSSNANDFLSTHPSDSKRIAEIKRRIPEAQAIAVSMKN